ncbi:MAG: carboxymuconolactone decarboxylase family protein [Oligoflexia bacterium]|nr:carboxymuconolactone decarboxylase family protein [Oligoflexia bacterium]
MKEQKVKNDIFNDSIKVLVAIGAAIAANCEPCFKYHYNEARKLGISDKDIRNAVKTAKMVKEAPAKAILQLAEKIISKKSINSSTSCSCK